MYWCNECERYVELDENDCCILCVNDELEKDEEIEESYDEFDYYYDEWKERRIYERI